MENELPALERDSPEDIMVRIVTECLKDPTVKQWVSAMLISPAVCEWQPIETADPNVKAILWSPPERLHYPLTPDEREELAMLLAEMDASSLGDRPQSIAAGKLARLIELEQRSVEGDIRITKPRNWTWATHFMPLPAPPESLKEIRGQNETTVRIIRGLL